VKKVFALDIISCQWLYFA